MKLIAKSYNKGTILLSIVLFIVIIDSMYRNVFISLISSVFESKSLDFDFIKNLLQLYRNVISYIALFFIKIFDHTVSFNSQQNILQFEYHQYIVSNQLGFLKSLYFLVLLFIYPFPIKKTLGFLVSGLLIINILIALRLAIISSNIYNERLIIVGFDLLYSLLLVRFLYYKIHSFYPVRKNYIKIQNKLQDTALNSSIGNIIIGLITFNFIAELLIYSIGTPITQILLVLSKFLMTLFGFKTTIHGMSLFLNHNYVYIGTSCLGIRLMVMFSMVMFFLKGTIKSKVIFTTIGVILIFLINVIRISYVLYHLHHYNNYRLTLSIHDLYDYTIYILTIVLWYVYAKWVSRSI